MICTFTKTVRKSFIILLLAIFWAASGFSQQFTIGTGTNTNFNTGYPAPYGNWFNGAKHQFLIQASELTAAGVTTQRMIQNLAFNVATSNGVALSNFTIKMANTTTTSLSTSFLTGLTQVYTVASYTEVAGWNTHTFNSPFTWDGTSNLVIEVCFDNFPNGYSYNAITYYSTTAFNSSNVYYSDNGGVCSNGTGYTASGDRTNMKLLITTPVPYDVVMNQVVSPTSWAVGNNTLTVQAANYGTNSLTAADFGYQVNSNTPVIQTGVSISPARTTGQTYNHTYSTVLNLPSAGTYNLKVWVRNPNGTGPDANTNNDTLTFSVCTGIAGTYTIDPAGSGANNFTTFTAAVNKLINCGISGPVTFNVANGTYAEKISIPSISGSSATNTVSFVGLDSSTCKLTYASTSGTDNYTLQLNGAKYFSFKNITFENTGMITSGTYYFAALLNNDASYDKFNKCKFSVPILGVNYYYYPVAFGICGGNYSSATAAVYDSVLNSRMVGGYYNTCYSGNSSNTGNAIMRNTIESYYYMGVTLYYGIGITLADNKIIRPSASAYYAVYMYYMGNYAISRNIIAAPYYGIYVGYSTTLGSRSIIDNNIIYNASSSNFYGIYGYAYGDYIHNTVFSNSSSGYCAYFYSPGSGKFVNNILDFRGATGYAMYSLPSYHAVVDYNNYYTTGTNFVYFGSTYNDLASLKAGQSAFNSKSISTATNYASTTVGALDLHLSLAAPAATGTNAYIATTGIDVDGEPHCIFAPSLGADESKYNTGTPVAGFTTPDTIFVNTPVVLLNNNSPVAPLGHRWYLNGTLMTSNVNLPYTFTATGSYTIKLVTFGCFGTDSITKTILVYNPTMKPVADFIADLNVVEVYQAVQLTDLSTKGPTYWYWTFTPSIGINYNNGTSNLSQNPTVSFSSPGLYQVCMWDSNTVGRSATLCKTAYILVKATNQMCIFPFDTKVASGTLYDDGGPNGNYSAGGSCNFLIDPCASSVTIKFSQFSLTTNSYIRVYNGNSNLAPPLHTSLGFTGTVIPGGAAGLTASSGKMYIEFIKGTAAAGFAASWSSVAATAAAPSGALMGPDTTYDCGAITNYAYKPSSLGFDRDAAYYKWWFNYTSPLDPADAEGKGLYNFDWSFGSTGTYVIRIDIEGCGGTETIYKTITVVHPTTGPIADFKADLLTATPADVVNLIDISKLDPIWWKWSITGPGPVTSFSGNANSKNYGVKFTTPGLYTVQLKDSNCVGSDTKIKTSYIKIISYCNPNVTTINPDFAIERVTFGRVDTLINNTILGFDFTNSSPAVGTVTYRDNTNQVKNYTVNSVIIPNKAVEAVVDLGGKFPFSVKRLSNFNAANINIWIDYNADGTFQNTELAASSGATTGITYSGNITIPTSATTGYTRMRIGTNFASLSNTPCGANVFGDYNDYRIKITPDVTAPTITFLPNNTQDTIYVEVGRTFVNPGDTVTDNVTNPTPYTRTGIASGTQITTYPSLASNTITATDGAGNVSIRTRFVKATPDVTKPVITMKGTSPVIVEVGSAYVDSGATATDFFFGSLTSSIVTTSTVNVNKIGTYTVTYNVSDAAGNAAIAVVRTVTVRDTQKPVITITGGTTVYSNVFSTFNPPTAVVTDNYNTGLTYTITGGPVDINKLGTYTLFYNASDSSGNAAVTAILTVIVRDVTAPQLTLLPQDTVIIDCITLTSVPEPGFIVTDNYYNSNQITVSKVGVVNLNVLGTYVIKYFATDPSGNVDSSKVRVYRVIDRGVPVITLKGLTIMNWPRWKNFITLGEPGYSVADHCDPAVSVTPDYTKLNIYLDGLYEVTYNAVDASGNRAAELKRYVNIYTEASGINANNGNNTLLVYPNPNNGLVNIDLNVENAKTSEIMVFDVNGKLIYSTQTNPVNSKLKIDLSTQPAGMYFVKVVAENFTSSKAFSIIK